MPAKKVQAPKVSLALKCITYNLLECGHWTREVSSPVIWRENYDREWCEACRRDRMVRYKFMRMEED